MARFIIENIEELVTVQSQLCISIFIPTHRYGHEVNDGMDRISLKNELQNVKNELEDRGLQKRYVAELLEPGFSLLDDSFFWRNMEEGLAVFISEGFFRYFTVPVSVKNQNFIAKDFIVTPLLSLLNENGQFYILDLNLDGIRLFRADKFDIEQIEITDQMFPQNIEQILKDYDFEYDLHRRNTGAGRSLAANFHGHSSDDDLEYKYREEFLKRIDTGLNKYLNQSKAPLILVGVDNIQAKYRKVNTYNNLIDKGVFGNHEYVNVKEIHQKALGVVEDYFKKPIKDQLDKYQFMAGTGKASYEVEDVFQNALAGRVETVFFNEDAHLWADIDANGEIHVHEEQQENDIDLFNSIAIQTLLNDGQVVPVRKEEIPEKEVDTELVAVYRY